MMTPRNEQETIISYDRKTREWHYYSDVPTHNRKWQQLVTVARTETDEYGNGNVIVIKRRFLTAEQRELNAQRLCKYRAEMEAKTDGK